MKEIDINREEVNNEIDRSKVIEKYYLSDIITGNYQKSIYLKRKEENRMV